MAESDYYIVDAFTSEAFRGNPAAVVILNHEPDEEWMQRVAAEMNLSETAFVEPPAGQPDNPRSLRWFTPKTEVDLCGHATLATGRVLGGSTQFNTRSGVLRCTAHGDGRVEIDFPADPVSALDTNAHESLLSALPGIEITFAGKGVSDILLVVTSEAAVRELRPNIDALLQLDARGVIVTASSNDPGADFVSRCFYPSVGVPEDPVTGSAHCTLAGWWGARLDRDELVGRQLSQRGGVVQMRLAGDRVHLIGNAVIVAKGQLLY